MARVIKTAGEIVSKFKDPSECDIACRVCKVRVVDDPPETPWVGYDGLGGKLMIDEHERCEKKP